VALRLAAPGLAATALLAFLAGTGGFASLLLLAAVVAGAARLLLAVGEAAEGRSDRFPVLTAAAGLCCLVAAGALHAPVLVVGLFVCSALEVVGGAAATPRVEPARRPEPADLVEAPASRAA
jgi:hypothetical protein